MQVQSKNKTTETCFEEILDFYHCVDAKTQARSEKVEPSHDNAIATHDVSSRGGSKCLPAVFTGKRPSRDASSTGFFDTAPK